MYVVRPDDAPRFDGIGEYAVSVSVTNNDRWIRSPSSRCTGTVRREMPRRCFALYEALWSRKLPNGISPEDLLLHGQAHDGSSDPIFLFGRTPAFLNESLAPIEAELERAVSRVVGLIRWRCDRTGPVSLPALGVHEWSMDGCSWMLDVRRPNFPSGSCGPDLVLSDTRCADIKRLLDAGEHEPLHQSLFREAVSLLESNPRSALAIGATAAEVAVKSLVSKVAPQAAWLVQNLPSPPIVRILEEYMSLVLPPGSPGFAQKLIKDLKVAVLLRNELVHGAKANQEPARISSAFGTFRDVVWLCDYFSGAPWAANRVSQDTRAAMNLPTTVDTSSGWFVD